MFAKLNILGVDLNDYSQVGVFILFPPASELLSFTEFAQDLQEDLTDFYDSSSMHSFFNFSSFSKPLTGVFT